MTWKIAKKEKNILLGGMLEWDKYNEMQNEKYIQAVWNMQHPDYWKVTFD